MLLALSRIRPATRCLLQDRRALISRRWQTTLESNPHIYVYPHPKGPPNTSLLTLLSNCNPPRIDLAVGSTTEIPPTPATVTENPFFMRLLQQVVAEHATSDPHVQAQAKVFASEGGMGLGSGGRFSRGKWDGRKSAGGSRGARGEKDASGASGQGGPGGGGVGGWVHVIDQRNAPDWGRTPYPEDILGSVEVDAQGNFVGERGEYQSSGTYRAVTREGILNLSPFLREKLVERLEEIEKERWEHKGGP